MELGIGHLEKEETDYSLYGTKIYDYEKKSIGLLIKLWDNGFWDNEGLKYYKFATCVDIEGKKYNTPMVNITPYDELSDEDLKELGL